MKILSQRKNVVSALLCLLLIVVTAPAQSGTSAVRGTVVDQQGQLVQGATVTLTSNDTKTVRTQITKENGAFAFDLIPPGSYKLEAEAKTFKKAIAPEIRALVARTTTVDLTLEIGNITESVTVQATGGDVLVNRQDATLGNNFESKQIVQLPLESRNVVQLLSLQPGVTPDGYVTGSRADQANVTLDGVDVNEQQTGLDPVSGDAFSSVLRVTPDSIQEFRVTTINPNAAQGRSSGAQVSLITKSGSNDLHGSLYEFHRNTATTANDFFNNRIGEPRPKLIRNVFGGSLGGPIKKERAFFFFTYEGRRDARETPVVSVVPLASLARGEVRFPFCPPADPTCENVAPVIKTLTAADINALFPVGVNPTGLAALADAARRYPANDFTVGDSGRDQLLNTAGFRFNASVPVRLNTSIVKLDYNLTEDGRHTVFLRGNYQQDNFSTPAAFPDTRTPRFWNHPWGIGAGHTWTVSNTKVNNFRYGLTREGFTSGGDSDENFISFRFVYQPVAFTRTLGRTTPVHNFTDDFSWIKGNHNFQFGTNIRLIRNHRNTFANTFDQAIANPSFYDASGAVLSRPISGIAPGFTSPVRTAVSAVIGRFSQYTVNLNYSKDGNLLPPGTGIKRTFATQEGDWYVQDSWKLHPTLTATLGLRYGLSRPIYEVNGLQTAPTVSLGDYFNRRVAAAAAGQQFNELITVDLAGPANDRPGYYPLDKNNFQPRLALAWSPDFKEGWLHKFFGNSGDTVIRGGFSITNDFIGQQLAVQFDLGADLGYATAITVAANTFNASDQPAPLFQGFGQDVRGFPIVKDRINPNLIFPLTQPADEDQRIEQSFDRSIVSPVNYSWSASVGRKLPHETFVEASYFGRMARHLLVTRDIMHLNNFTDKQSGMDWYTAAHQLYDLRGANTPIDRVPKIAYFENLFRGLGDNLLGDPSLTPTQAAYILIAREEVGGFNILDFTFAQLLLDDLSTVGPNLFFQPQYAALAAFSTLGESDYHAGTLTVRQRYRNSLTFDFNYTFSKSFDNASGLQQAQGGIYGAAFVVNPLDLRQSRAESDFDIRHIINANALWEFPVGHGKKFFSGMPGYANAIFGGWQLSGIFRWNSGIPVQTPFDASQWATNWNVQSNGVRLKALKSSPTRGGKDDPNLFSDPVAAYQSFRNAIAGEVGDRNILRIPSYVTLDMGLGKTFKIKESHQLQFRWEVFNVTNTQHLRLATVTRDNLGLDIDPNLATPGPAFGKLDAIQGTPRVMQFGLRYTF